MLPSWAWGSKKEKVQTLLKMKMFTNFPFALPFSAKQKKKCFRPFEWQDYSRFSCSSSSLDVMKTLLLVLILEKNVYSLALVEINHKTGRCPNENREKNFKLFIALNVPEFKREKKSTKNVSSRKFREKQFFLGNFSLECTCSNHDLDRQDLFPSQVHARKPSRETLFLFCWWTDLALKVLDKDCWAGVSCIWCLIGS